MDVILNVQKNGSEGAECDGKCPVSGIACDAVGPDLNRDHLGLVRRGKYFK